MPLNKVINTHLRDLYLSLDSIQMLYALMARRLLTLFLQPLMTFLFQLCAEI